MDGGSGVTVPYDPAPVVTDVQTEPEASSIATDACRSPHTRTKNTTGLAKW